MDAIFYIFVGIVALGVAYYLSGRILKSSQEKSKDDAKSKADAIVVPKPEWIDNWQGFIDAHKNHPPVFAENDSWGVEAG